MFSSKSHIGSMLSVATALSKAGHNVSFIELTHSSEGYPFPDDINVYFIRYHKNPLDTMNFHQMWAKRFPPYVMSYIFAAGDAVLRDVLKNDNEELRKIINSTWDVVIVDDLFSATVSGIALKNAENFGNPYIMFSTTVPMQIFNWELALGSNIVTSPSMHLEDADDVEYDVTNYWHRLKSFYFDLVAGVSLKLISELIYNEGIRMLGVDNFSYSKLWKTASFNFRDDLNNMVFPNPVSNDIVRVGSHCRKHKTLSPEMKAFIEDPSSKGTIFIAFGTYVDWRYAPTTVVRAFVEALRMLVDYRIIFVSSSGTEANYPNHVKVLRWAPQFDILHHNKTLLFVSHCGLKSLKESICSTTPIICIPMFAEQTHNAAICYKLGICRSLSKFSLDARRIYSLILHMINDPKYRHAVGKARESQIRKLRNQEMLSSRLHCNFHFHGKPSE
ncbi:hypothetical protein AB6A40_003173 [Gnathostoma spinigerum]|uniref:UDP-glucuronosyltransferase n=1 Tax=Gnathostoma spinigerum TaxID=75299 RepID=A0ABD6EEB2_9BILA